MYGPAASNSIFYQDSTNLAPDTWWLGFAGHRTATNMTTNTPAGWTARAGTATECRIMDSTTTGTGTQSVSASSGWVSASIAFGTFPEKTTPSVYVVNKVVGATTTTSPAPLMPHYRAGDLILAVVQVTGSATIPSLPGGWTDVHNVGASSSALRVAYQVAGSDSPAVRVSGGTWTGAGVGRLTYTVFRKNSSASWDAPVAATSNNATGTSITFPDLAAGSNPRAYVRCLSSPGGSFTPNPLTGWPGTSTAVNYGRVFDTDEDVAGTANSVGADTGTLSSSQIWRANTIRISCPVLPPEGQGSGTYTWASAATGKRTPQATASGTYTWAGAATGKSNRAASAGTSTYTWAASAEGKRVPKAQASGTYQWETGSVGDANYAGQAAGTYTWSSGAVGVTPVDEPTGTGTYGWAGTAVGYSHRSASASPTYTWAAAATGKKYPRASAGTSTYNWAAAAVGSTPSKGQAAGTYSWAGQAIGHQTGTGIASGTYSWSSLATGLFTPKPVAGVVGWESE